MALLQLPVARKSALGILLPPLFLSSDSIMGPDPVLCNYAVILSEDTPHYPYKRAQASIFTKTLGREKILMASSTCTSFWSSSARWPWALSESAPAGSSTSSRSSWLWPTGGPGTVSAGQGCMVPSGFPIQPCLSTYLLWSRLLSVSSRWFSGMRVWPGGMAGSGWLCWRASASRCHRSLRSNKLWMHRLRVDDPRADISSYLPQAPLTLDFGQWDLLMGHMALLCGIVVLLSLPLLLQHLCQDLK